MQQFECTIMAAGTGDVSTGIEFYGTSPDHETARKVFNDFVGDEILELRGSALGTHLFLPASKYRQWQLFATWKEIWLKDVEKEGKVEAIIDLDFIQLMGKGFYTDREKNQMLQCGCGWTGAAKECLITYVDSIRSLAGWRGLQCACPKCHIRINRMVFARS